MRKRVVGVFLVCVIGVSVLGAQTSPTSDYVSQFLFLQRILTGKNAVATSDPAFVPLVRTEMPVPAGLRVLISAKFSAESQCTEAPPASTNWCSVRILIAGVEAEPLVGSDFAFDSTTAGADVLGSWESHSMDRHRCYTNTTGASQNVPVVVEWGITNFDGGVAPSFRIDDWSLVIQESLDCFDIPTATPASESAPQPQGR